MKYIKTYENDDWMKTPKFKIGETVIAVMDCKDELKGGEKYIIEDIIYNQKYKVKGIDRYFWEEWFIPEYEADAKKYNL